MTVATAGNAGLIQIIVGPAVRLIIAILILLFVMALVIVNVKQVGLPVTVLRMMRMGASVILVEVMFVLALLVARL